MAERPVFVPVEQGSRLVDEVPIVFEWNPGMAPSQKKKNVEALHRAAEKRGLTPLLEISSKSEREVGRKLSAFSLEIDLGDVRTTIESAYQGSKVFERGGPYVDLFYSTSRDAKKDLRLKESGKLTGFRFQGEDFPLSPTTAFYDWLYISALFPHRDWLKRLQRCAGFTDIEFNPERSLNCQARSIATFISLEKRNLLDRAMLSFENFKELEQSAAI
jgi:hypothetical protein